MPSDVCAYCHKSIWWHRVRVVKGRRVRAFCDPKLKGGSRPPAPPQTQRTAPPT